MKEKKMEVRISEAARFVMDWASRLGHGCAVDQSQVEDAFPEDTRHDAYVGLHLLDAFMRIAGARNNAEAHMPGLPGWYLEVGDDGQVNLSHTTGSGRLRIFASEYRTEGGRAVQFLQLEIFRGGEYEGLQAVVLQKVFKESAFGHGNFNEAEWDVDEYDSRLVDGREDVLALIDLPEIRKDLRNRVHFRNDESGNCARLLAALKVYRQQCAATLLGQVLEYVEDPDGVNDAYVENLRQQAEELIAVE